MADLVINKEYRQLEGFIKNLPEQITRTGETLYSGRNLIKVFDIEGLKINVKSFKKPIFINRIAYTFFRKSKAKRSYQYALRLKEKGFNTPDPIAYMEVNEGGLLDSSYYISIQEEYDGILRELKQGTLNEHKELIVRFASYTANLHDNRILHLDYSPGNILYKKKDGQYSFYLVDLNRMEFDKEITLDKACFNFRRLWGSDDMIKLFVEEYAKARGFDIEESLQRAFRYRKDFWEKFTRKHPQASPYIG